MGVGVSIQTASAATLQFGSFFAIAVAILAVVNGLFLLKRTLEDRPILRVKAVYPEVYQWYFALPPVERNGHMTRRYGFLIYVDVINRGRRDVQLDSWTLRVRSITGAAAKLNPLSIPEPSTTLGDGSVKIWPVLGMAGPRTSGSTLVRSGMAVDGFAYYTLGYWGAPRYDLHVGRRGVRAVLEVRSILGQRARKELLLQRVELDRAQQLIPRIEEIDAPSPETPDDEQEQQPN